MPTIDLNLLLSPPQIVGYLATAVNISAFALTRDAALKRTLAAGSVLLAVHYAMLSSWTSALTVLFIASRQGLAVFAPQFGARRRLILGIAYLALFTAILVLTWIGPISIWPWLAAINATYALFWLSGVRMRSQLMASDVFWLINAVLVGSAGHFVASIIAITINLLVIRKLHQRGD
jgi:hypothetical protein